MLKHLQTRTRTRNRKKGICSVHKNDRRFVSELADHLLCPDCLDELEEIQILVLIDGTCLLDEEGLEDNLAFFLHCYGAEGKLISATSGNIVHFPLQNAINTSEFWNATRIAEIINSKEWEDLLDLT